VKQQVTWRCPNHSSYVGDPDENPHTEIEAEWTGSDEESDEAKAFRTLDELAADIGCSCGATLVRTSSEG
jgi:hypothetical protein